LQDELLVLPSPQLLDDEVEGVSVGLVAVVDVLSPGVVVLEVEVLSPVPQVVLGLDVLSVPHDDCGVSVGLNVGSPPSTPPS
jgi:hypothetical protein